MQNRHDGEHTTPATAAARRHACIWTKLPSGKATSARSPWLCGCNSGTAAITTSRPHLLLTGGGCRPTGSLAACRAREEGERRSRVLLISARARTGSSKRFRTVLPFLFWFPRLTRPFPFLASDSNLSPPQFPLHAVSDLLCHHFFHDHITNVHNFYKKNSDHLK